MNSDSFLYFRLERSDDRKYVWVCLLVSWWLRSRCQSLSSLLVGGGREGRRTRTWGSLLIIFEGTTTTLGHNWKLNITSLSCKILDSFSPERFCTKSRCESDSFCHLEKATRAWKGVTSALFWFAENALYLFGRDVRILKITICKILWSYFH